MVVTGESLGISGGVCNNNVRAKEKKGKKCFILILVYWIS
jgi:hypothetical protein